MEISQLHTMANDHNMLKRVYNG